MREQDRFPARIIKHAIVSYAIIFVLASLFMCSCRTTKSVNKSHEKDDSINVEHVADVKDSLVDTARLSQYSKEIAILRDSIRKVQFKVDSVILHDSVFVYVDGESKTKEVWHTEYKYKYLYDTIYCERLRIDSTASIREYERMTRSMQSRIDSLNSISTHVEFETEYIYQEKQLSRWQRCVLRVGGYCIGLLCIAILIICAYIIYKYKTKGKFGIVEALKNKS